MDAAPPAAPDARTLSGFLSAWLEARRNRDPGYSIRDFADEAGERDRTILHAILRGTRRCTPDMIERWLPLLLGTQGADGPTADLLRAMALAEQALAVVQRREAWAARRETPDALAQRDLARERLDLARRTEALARAAAQGRLQTEGQPHRSACCSVGLDDSPVDLDGLLGWLRQGEQALLGVAPPPGLKRAVHGLTEATGPGLRTELLARIALARDELLALDEGGPLHFHTQIVLFPLTRVLREDVGSPRAPASGAASGAVDAPDVYSWGAAGDGGVQAYLSAWLQWRQAQDPAYSLEDFAADALQPDRTLLWKVIHQPAARPPRRQRWCLTPMRALQFARGDGTDRHPGLGLTEDEARYFALLAERDGASGVIRAHAQRRLDEERAMAAATRLPLGRVQRWQGPAHWALLVLRGLAGWRPDPAWNAEALWPPDEPEAVGRVLADLDALGLEGALARELELVHLKGDPLLSPITHYHQAMKARASAVFAPEAPSAPGPRAGFALTLRLAPGGTAALHARLEGVTRELQRLCAGSAEVRDQVLQVNVHGWDL